MRNVSYVLAIQGKMCYDHSYFSVIGQLESIKDLKKAYILTLKCTVILISTKCHHVGNGREGYRERSNTRRRVCVCVCVCLKLDTY